MVLNEFVLDNTTSLRVKEGKLSKINILDDNSSVE